MQLLDEAETLMKPYLTLKVMVVPPYGCSLCWTDRLMYWLYAFSRARDISKVACAAATTSLFVL